MNSIIKRSLLAAATTACILLCSATAFSDTQTSEKTETSLQAYSQMSVREQSIVILDAKDVVFNEFLHDDTDRAACVAPLFRDSKEGTEQWKYLKTVLDISSKKQYPQSAEQITRIVIQNKFCPVKAESP